MEPTPDRYDKELGFIFGLLLVIIWIALLLFIESALFPRQDLWQNPFSAWSNVGLLPFVMMSGDHLIYRRKPGGVETVRSVIGLKSNLLGFLLWFPALGILYLEGYTPSYQVNGVGGLLAVLVLYLAWDWSATRRNPRPAMEQG